MRPLRLAENILLEKFLALQIMPCIRQLTNGFPPRSGIAICNLASLRTNREQASTLGLYATPP